ncbi:unnamed protein product [Boreogadus saida]
MKGSGLGSVKVSDELIGHELLLLLKARDFICSPAHEELPLKGARILRLTAEFREQERRASLISDPVLRCDGKSSGNSFCAIKALNRLTFTQANNKRSFSRPDVNMAQVNGCLKRTVTFFNILFAILGALVIGLALVSQAVSQNNGAGELEGRTTGLIMLYIIGSVTMMIAILGAYGAHKENKGALVAFLVFMVVGTLIMLKTGASMAISSPQIENVMEQKFRSLLPLDQSPKSTQNMMSSIQTTLQCCGLFSYEDWENNIPSSCVCNSEQEMEGTCRTVNDYGLLQYHQKTIFSATCFPIIMHYAGMAYYIYMAVVFSLGTLALLGMVLSSVIIHQMGPNVPRPMMVLSIPAVFSPQPPKYQELYNSPA